MKYTQIFAVLALGLSIASCTKEDDSVFDLRNVKPVITVDATSFPSLTEGDVVTLTLTTDVPYKTDMDLKISLVGGNASFRDFVVESPVEGRVAESSITDGQGNIAYLIKFPAYAKTATVTLSPVVDDLVEPTENFILELASALNGIAAVAESSKIITMSAKNKTSLDFNVTLDWSGAAPNRHGTIVEPTYKNNAVPTPANRSFCGIDFDLEVYNSTVLIPANIVDASYDNCPEKLTLPASTPDGSYFIVATFYSMNGALNLTAPNSVNIPLILTSSKPGIFVNVMNATGRFTTTSTAGSTVRYIMREVVKAGSTWTVKDITTGNVLNSGRNFQTGNNVKFNTNKRK